MRTRCPAPPARSTSATGILFALAGLLLASAASAAQQPRGMVPEDYHRLTFVSDPRISPDGERVAFVARTVSDDRRSREGRIWTVPTDGLSDPQPVTDGPTDAHPRWSPDGTRIAYFADDDEGRRQVHVVSDGSPMALTDLRSGRIVSFEWTPQGDRIVLTLDLKPGADPRVEPDEGGPDIVVIRDAVYKSDESGGYLGEDRHQLWLLEVGDGTLRALTPGDPRWNDRDVTVSPDGGRVAFLRHDEELDGAHERELWFLGLDGGVAEPLDAPAGRIDQPVWGPANDRVAYVFTPEPFARPHVHTHSIVGDARTVLTTDVDRVPRNLTWHPSGDHLYFTADHRGTHPLYRLETDGSGATPLFGEDGQVVDPTVSADGSRLVFTYENEIFPPEVWTSDADGRNPRPLTGFNDELVQGLALSRFDEVLFQNPEGFPLQGWVLRPAGWTEGETYPLVLNIKGGPGGMWGHQWFPEFHMLASAGYGVAFVNYRGSTGYGHEHRDAVRLDYGGADATDNLLFLDEVLDRHEWVDPDRLFVTGGSHGGFLTAWLTTQTDRFRAAAPQRMVSNWISEAGTQEFAPRRMIAEFGGTIWDNFELYWDRSPLAHAPQVTTPTLIIHSTDDRVTPIGQGEEWFYALKALDVPAEMIVFVDEGHGLSRSGKPINLVERIRRIIDWFDRHDAP